MVFSSKQYPDRDKDLSGSELEFSVDVIICDKENMLNIGYWNFDTEKWEFHADTLVDPYEGGELMPFVWMYKPEMLSCSSLEEAPVKEPYPYDLAR